MRFISYLRKDAQHIFRNPRILLRFRHRSVRQRFFKLAKARLFQAKLADEWESREEHFQHRQYDNYDQYVEHQKLKVDFLNLTSEYDERFRTALAARVESMDIVEKGAKVVCLAARIGSEVKAFKDAGCFAVGIDLNPGEANQHVLHGDFHDLQFPNNSVDFVYTNSLDHAFDIEKIVGEVRRVLRPNGVFLLEAVRGSHEGLDPQEFESFWWDSIDDLVHLIESLGMELVGRLPFKQPWNGIQLQLKNVKDETTPSEETAHASA